MCVLDIYTIKRYSNEKKKTKETKRNAPVSSFVTKISNVEPCEPSQLSVWLHTFDRFFFILYVWMWISTKTYALFNQIQVHISRTEAMPDSFQSSATVDSGWLKIGAQSCQLLLFQCNYYCYFWRCWLPFGVLFFSYLIHHFAFGSAFSHNLFSCWAIV